MECRRWTEESMVTTTSSTWMVRTELSMDHMVTMASIWEFLRLNDGKRLEIKVVCRGGRKHRSIVLMRQGDHLRWSGPYMRIDKDDLARSTVKYLEMQRHSAKAMIFRNARILEAPTCVASRKKSENIDIEEVVNNNVLGK